MGRVTVANVETYSTSKNDCHNQGAGGHPWMNAGVSRFRVFVPSLRSIGNGIFSQK